MSKLDGVHPILRIKVERILQAMSELGFQMMVFEGIRSTERQKKLYAQGRTAPGNIVTNADGVIKKSNHQVKDDGYGYAVDCVFLEKNKPTWSLQYPWKLYGAMVESQGLNWGGSWKSITDLPHAELKNV